MMTKQNFTFILITFIYAVTLFACSSSQRTMGDMVARMEVKKPIEGVCDNNNVIAILPFPGNGQVKAVAPLTNEEITKQLNAEVKFLKGKSDYNDEGMVSLIVNCKGEMVQCEIDNKTQNEELDQQVVAVFAKLKKWTPGKVKGQNVDTVVLYSFTVTNGIIEI